MINLRLSQLPDSKQGHVLSAFLPGEFLSAGALSFKPPCLRTHSADGPDGDDRHVHEDREAFVILQGKAVMQVDGVAHPLVVGDILIIEPGEDHHLVSDEFDPCINLWLHAGPERHPAQRYSS
jgi:mannose-6-phosphate isomerase-like protein (cupin superfamily)